MMKKAGFIMLFVVVLFGMSKPPTFALTEQVSDAVATAEAKNNDTKDNKKTEESQVALPVEVPVTIAVPSVVPTVIPLPTIVVATPTVAPLATNEATPTPTTKPVDPVTPIIGNAGGKDATPKKEEKKTETPPNPTTNVSLQTSATTVAKSTVAKTVSKTPQNKPVPTTKVGNIIVPTITSDVKVKGANYYIDEKLSRDTTLILFSVSFFLFIMGLGVLNLPNFIRSVADIRRKNAEHKSEESFTVRYLEF